MLIICPRLKALLATNVAVQLALVVLWSLSSSRRTIVSIAAAGICLVVAIVLNVLSYYEHTRTIRPSSTIEVYLLMSIAFDAVQVRSLWLQQDLAVASVLTTGLLVKVCLLLLETTGKRSFLTPPYTRLSTESTSGIFNRNLFYWLNGLFLLGSRAVLSLKDLPILNESLKSANLYEQSSDYVYSSTTLLNLCAVC